MMSKATVKTLKHKPDPRNKSTFQINRKIDRHFWESYTSLWNDSEGKSPFKSPSILQYFATLFPGKLSAVQYFKDTKLMGAVLLKKEKSHYSFLSDLKTDANFFVFHRECGEKEFRFFFTEFFKKIKTKRWTLTLNYVPAWANYINILDACGKKSGIFFQNMSYSVCPIIEVEHTDQLNKIINSSGHNNRKYNKLVRQLDPEFEILTDNQDLEFWLKEFCDCHIKRWENTSTPSIIKMDGRISFLLGCLKAWCQDGILVRFSVKTNNQRIAFIIGLREGRSLILHSTTFHPGFRKYSPGQAAIRSMAEWMIANDLKIFDFGDGGESYKYELANKELIINRIFITGRHNYQFILKSKLIKLLRKESRVYNFYRNKVKLLFSRQTMNKIKVPMMIYLGEIQTANIFIDPI